jgi:hypothetical protein
MFTKFCFLAKLAKEMLYFNKSTTAQITSIFSLDHKKGV